MSGTSADGVDASIIQSNGDTEYEVILDKYFKYNEDIYKNIHSFKDKINNSRDLESLSKEIQLLEREITLFHAKAVNEIIKESKIDINFIGFHGQTIFHKAEEKISKQLGDGKLLSELTKKTVVYNFRQNDLKNDGQGAPLTPIFHRLLKNKYKIKTPLIILNIGGIANVTRVDINENMYSYDIGPGNCLIDQWIRINSDKQYDKKGSLAKSGKINKIVLNKALKRFKNGNHFKALFRTILLIFPDFAKLPFLSYCLSELILIH
jgi:anhydro-N-acetylmuramic acid kinase